MPKVWTEDFQNIKTRQQLLYGGKRLYHYNEDDFLN